MFKIFLNAYLLLFTFVTGSHFRGGYITWRPVSNVPPGDGSLPQVLFNYRVSWRRSVYFCNQQTIALMTNIRGEGSLRCTGCIPSSDSFDFICTAFNAQDDWTSGVGSALFTPSSNTFVAFFAGSDWVNFINGGGGPWNLRAIVNLNTRPDNLLLNTSPVTSTFPVVRAALNCQTTITIPVVDVDGDIVKCRYAVGFSECASVCQPLPGAVFDQDNCSLQWTPSTAPGLYAVAVQIEDYVDATSTTPLSSVPSQFILDVRSLGPCSNAPSFAPDALATGTCVGVPRERTFTTRITASVPDPSQSITTINTISSFGVTTTPVQQVIDSTTDYFIDVTFTATAQSQARELLCFVALTNIGFPSEQRCIIFATDVAMPVPLAASVDKNNIVTVTIDQMVRRRDTSGSVRIVYAANHQLVYTFDVSTSEFVTFPDVTSHFKIQLPLPLLTCEKYLLQLDGGMVETLGDCPAGNDPVDLPLMIEKPRPKKKFCF